MGATSAYVTEQQVEVTSTDIDRVEKLGGESYILAAGLFENLAHIDKPGFGQTHFADPSAKLVGIEMAVTAVNCRGERAAFESEGRPFALRFAMPEHDVTIEDLVKGPVRFPQGSLGDFVIVRSDGSPVFLLAVGAIIGTIGAATGPETKDVDFH